MLTSVLLFLLGLAIVTLTLFSAVSSFVLTRGARHFLDRFVFGLLWRVFHGLMRFTRSYAQRDALMAYYAPLALVLLLPSWYLLTAVGYALMYWALGVPTWQQAFLLSGSSLLTLGYVSDANFLVSLLTFTQATLGLLLVALLITYLPSMYAAFSRREQAVTLLEVRAGSPPTAVGMLQRFYRIHGVEQLNADWQEWEAWFADLGESHSVLPALVFFRSPVAQNSWVQASGVVLDAAALSLAALDLPVSPTAQLALRSGYLALRRICDYFDIPYPPDPHFPADPIQVARAEFDAALAALEAAGLPLKPDREQAWQDFAGWRVNYDATLRALSDLTMAPHAPWYADPAAGQL
jgi:hypothetical protein